MSDSGESGAEYEDIELNSAGLPITVQPPAYPPSPSHHFPFFSSSAPDNPYASSSLPRPSQIKAMQQMLSGFSNTLPRLPSNIAAQPGFSDTLPHLPSNIAAQPGLFFQEQPPPLPPPNPGKRKFMPTREAPHTPPNRPARSQTFSAPHSTSTSVNGDPPPRPPKPPPKAVSIDFSEFTKKLKKRTSEDFILCSDELSLPKFVEQHQDEFPVRVRVCKGFYGVTERTSVSEGDCFNIHFVKKSKVVGIEDAHGCRYKIALNSAIEFGLLYNPNDNEGEAEKGFTFEKVSDILAMKKRPKAVRAMKAVKGSKEESSLKEHELLILKDFTRKMSGWILKAYSLVSGKKKELPESCAGHFSTKPYDVRLFLPEIVEYIPHPFPTTVVLYLNAETAHELPSALISNIISLTAISIETSLIATSAVEDVDIDNTQLIDIPYDLDIEVQVTRPKDAKDMEQLHAETRTIFETFDPSRLCPYIDADSSSTYETQAAFYALVRDDKEGLAGVDLVPPGAIYENRDVVGHSSPHISKKSTPTASPGSMRPLPAIPPPVPTKPSKTSRSPFSPSDANSPSFELVAVLENRVAELENRLKKFEGGITLDKLQQVEKMEANMTKLLRDLTSVRADCKRNENRITKCLEDVSQMKTELTRIGPTTAHLVNMCEGLQREMSQLKHHLGGEGIGNGVEEDHPNTLSSPLSPTSVSADIVAQNRKYLASLDCVGVLQLLDAMGMKKYQDAFVEERITGEILMECDEEVMATELQVSSKLHRLRLTKVISGFHSAEKIMSGEGPYVYASAAIKWSTAK